MKEILSFAILTLVTNLSFGQSTYTPEKLGWTPLTISDKKLGNIHFYVSSNRIKETKPVIVYLDGSGNYPLYQYTERGIAGTIALNVKELSNKYHIVVISKPGIPFIDSVKMVNYGGMQIPSYKDSDEYDKHLSLEWRAEAASLVLDKVLKDFPTDKKKVGVIGISEGFSVGAKLASINAKVTHSVLVIGNGLNQFFDFIIQKRNEALIGKITHEEAQQQIDSLYADFRNIYTNKNSTTDKWQGHTYLRWASFCNSLPMNDILKANIPTHIIACANDVNTAVLGTDYLYLESIRQGRNNIDYKVYPYDHFFNETLKNESGEVTGSKNHTLEVIALAVQWLDKK